MAPIVATPVFELDQLPPPVALVSVVLPPIHTPPAPPIAAGVRFTVFTDVAKHPVAIV